MVKRNICLIGIIAIAILNLIYLAFWAPRDLFYQIWFICVAWIIAVAFVFFKEE